MNPSGPMTLMSPRAAARESLRASFAIVGVLAVVMYAINGTAFSSFFYGEDFNLRAQYLLNGGDWFSTVMVHTHGQFRPSALVWRALSEILLPWDPTIYHWRNFLLGLVNLYLLDRILLRLTRSLAARVIAVAFFAVSNVHLTIIGMTQGVDSITTLFYILTCTLFLIRFLQDTQKKDLALALLSYTLACFGRDASSLFVAVPVFLLAVAGWKARRDALTWHQYAGAIGVFVLLFIGFWIFRGIYVGSPEAGGAVPYALRFDPAHVLVVLSTVLGTVLNVAYGKADVVGIGDLAFKLAGSSPLQSWLRLGYAIPTFLLILATVALAIRRRTTWAIAGLMWFGAFMFPVLLIGNLQVYYAYEPLVGVALLIALGLESIGKWSRAATAIWIAALVLLAGNAFFHSRQIQTLNWRFVSDQVGFMNRDIFVPNRGASVRSLNLFVADTDRELYTFAVTPVIGPGKYNYAMLKLLLSPDIRQLRLFDQNQLSSTDFCAWDGHDLVYRYQPIPPTWIAISPVDECNNSSDLVGSVAPNATITLSKRASISRQWGMKD